MMRFATFFLFAIAGAIAIYQGGRTGAASLERMTLLRVEQGFAVLDIDWVTLSGDGLLIDMRGRAPNLEAQELAAKTARATAPYAHIVDYTSATISPPVPRDPIAVEIYLGQDGITATGNFFGEEMKARFARLLAEARPDLALHDLTGTSAARTKGAFRTEIALASVAVGSVSEAFVTLEPGSVTIEAVLPDQQTLDAMRVELLQMAGSDVALKTDLRVPPRIAIPYRFSIWKDFGGVRLEACSARDAGERERILSALSRLGPQDSQQGCPVALGGPDADWARAVEAGIAALEAIPAGRIELTYLTARMEVNAPMAGPEFDGVVAALTGALPERFALEPVREPGPAAASVPKDGYWLRIDADRSGLHLSGKMPDRAGADALVLFASALTSIGEVSSDLAIGTADGPPDWLLTAEAVLGLKQILPVFMADITPGLVRLSGRVDNPQDAGRADRLLRNSLPGIRISSEIAVELPQAIAALPLEAEACLAQLNRAISGAPISFEVASAVIAPASNETLDRLAGIQRRCADTTIEIAGHTDSQGGEAFNRRLSKLRAESVLSALTERGVPYAALQAQGYGEAEPIADNATPEGRALNRRIEFRLSEAPPRRAAAETADTPERPEAGASE